jgi:hypothetical protein
MFRCFSIVSSHLQDDLQLDDAIVWYGSFSLVGHWHRKYEKKNISTSGDTIIC